MLPHVHLRLHLNQLQRHGRISTLRNRVTTHLEYPAPSATNASKQVLARYYFHSGVLPYLPQRDGDWRYRSCAVVSNSGAMLLHEYGEQIGKTLSLEAHEVLL